MALGETLLLAELLGPSTTLLARLGHRGDGERHDRSPFAHGGCAPETGRPYLSRPSPSKIG